MNAVANISEHNDPRIAVAEIWLCMLGGLAQLAKRLCRFLVREITPYPKGSKGLIFARPLFGNPIAAFQRVVRALRFVALVVLKIETEIASLRAGAPLGPYAFLSRLFRTRAISQVGRDAAANGPEELEQEDRKTVQEREARERFEALNNSEPVCDDETFQALLNGSLKNAIAAICDDLGLKPDWRLWTDHGFPPPAGDRVEDWAAFFESGPIEPPAGHIWDGRLDEAWRLAWPPPDLHDTSPIPYPTAARPPDRGASP